MACWIAVIVTNGSPSAAFLASDGADHAGREMERLLAQHRRMLSAMGVAHHLLQVSWYSPRGR